MLVLGIETSCDETSVSVVRNGTEVLSLETASSLSEFAALGGVVPELAARRQLEWMIPVLGRAIVSSKHTSKDIDAIAVTYTPGLLGSLLVGTTCARALACVWNKPVIPVHHTLGHLSSTWLETTDEPQFPIITLSVSGGHSDIWYRTSHTSGKLIGSTIDDAAGEAFDKGASMLSLPYPGGPHLSKLAGTGNETAYSFTRPLSKEETMNFSFSGLKTSLKYLLRDLKEPITDAIRSNIAASYQLAICYHLVHRITESLTMYPQVKEVHVVGGVSANKRLRSLTEQKCSSVKLRYPQTKYCTDNGAMIAAAGFFMAQEELEVQNTDFVTAAREDLLLTSENRKSK